MSGKLYRRNIFIKGGDLMTWLADLAQYWWVAVVGALAFVFYYFTVN